MQINVDKVDVGRKASSLGFRWVDLAVLQKSFNFSVTSDDFFIHMLESLEKLQYTTQKVWLHLS